MSVNLVKGQKVSLVKENDSLSDIMVGLGWDAAKRGLFHLGASNIDCDASVILCGEDGKAIGSSLSNSTVYYGHLNGADGAVHHCGDNLTGDGDGDDEEIMVDLNHIPAKINKLVFVVNIYQAEARRQHFGMIKNAFIRIVDRSTNKELCRYNLSDNYDHMTGMIAGEIYRHDGVWKFNAVGQGVQNASSITSMVNLYR